MCQRQRTHQSLLLLEIQSSQVAVVLLRNAQCLKNVVVQFLLRLPCIEDQERYHEHALVLALQLLQKTFGVLSIRCKIGRNDIHVVSCTNCFFLLLDLGTIQIRNRMFDLLDCLCLIDRPDMHRDHL